ncbi:unnamed protein product [Didymodactylos carnosus]|uniref:ZZ-type domain-containing protein n=1 Tax=Didymodactylos carnosus TaxID=1234261 RepID=A0A813U8X3_9BILA|nr:unnamed protein product [Didymodactylos carnosus]CAF0979924.1 unnamed protein product [Didymodactylos carnosus]CAF3612138.1 unnamed protein product [Didymodactylos carnosus]CAF3750565.1 unnamed protein product [Didymodactylos carnosus]
MTSLVYIKAYYTNSNQAQAEIRRFTIDISPGNDVYRDLTTKVATFNPDIQLNGFTLQYVDDENERITFSSNDELHSAIATNKGSTLKIFVTPNASSQQQRESTATSTAVPGRVTTNNTRSDGECHVGVVCDGCNGPVIGIRYKCFVCPNYDLCEQCSDKGIHSEHITLKITKPGNNASGSSYYHPYCHQGRRHFGGQNDGGHSSQHPHHRRRFWNHHQQQRSSTRDTPTTNQTSGTPTPPFPFIPDPQFFEYIQNQLPQWMPNAESAVHLRTHMQQHFNNLKENSQNHITNSKHYLENVGKFLQQALSPFGIDCDYSVDEHTKQQQQQPTATDDQPTQSQQQEHPQSAVNDSKEMQTENESVPLTKLTESISTPMESVSAALHEPSAVPKTSVYPELPANNNNGNNASISTILNAFRATQSSTSAPPPPKINTMDKQIDECVECMKAMGFVDTNGVLTELVRSKEGDLNQIDITSSSSIYRELVTKVITYNPNIQINGFKLQYIDNENEHITFSTDEELKCAIATKKEYLLKIFVVPNSIQSLIPSHCDYCHKEIIRGESYKIHHKTLCKTCLTRQHERRRSLKSSSSSKQPRPLTTSHPYYCYTHPRMSPSSHDTYPDVQYTPFSFIPPCIVSPLTSIAEHLDRIHKLSSMSLVSQSPTTTQTTTTTTSTQNQPLVDDLSDTMGTTPSIAMPNLNTMNLSSHKTQIEATATDLKNDDNDFENKLDECVNRLKTMGIFLNENDSLIDLIKSNDYDINLVLTALSVKETKNR